MPIYLDNILLSIYFLLFLMLSFFAITVPFSRRKMDDICVFFIFIVTFCLFTLRSGYSPDEITYYNHYMMMTTYDKFSYGYPVYILFKLFHYLNLSFYSFSASCVFLVNCIFTIAIYSIIKPRYRAISLFIFSISWFYIDLNTNTIRQGLASGFVLLFFNSCKDRKSFSSLCFFIISIGLHWTAIIPNIVIMLSLFTVVNKKYKFFFYSSFVLLLLSAFINLNIIGEFNHILTGINFNERINDKFSGYLIFSENSFYSMGPIFRLVMLFEMIFSFSLFLLFLKYVKDNTLLFVFSMLTIYASLFLAMPFGFRNFYWPLIFFPIIFTKIIINIIEGGVIKPLYMIGLFVLLYVVYSSVGFWRSPIINVLYN